MASRKARLLGSAIAGVIFLTVPVQGATPADKAADPAPRLVVFELFTPPESTSGGG